MKTTAKHNERIAKMTFASVYPHYVIKVESKGRTKEELHQVIEWLTGFNELKLQKLINNQVTFEIFFQKATLNLLFHNAALQFFNKRRYLRLSDRRNRKSINKTSKVFRQTG